MSKEMSRLKIQVGKGPSYYNLLTNTIFIGSDQIEEAKSLDDIIDVINHEMQHAVQRNFGAREDTRDIPLKEKALDMAHRYNYARSANNPNSVVPIVERDAVFLQKDPTRGSWYHKMTPEEKKVYEGYENEYMNKSEFRRVQTPPPKIVIGEHSGLNPVTNVLTIGEQEFAMASEEEFPSIVLNILNHELQHHAQFSPFNVKEKRKITEQYKKQANKRNFEYMMGIPLSEMDIPLLEYDALQSENNPFLSSWYRNASDKQKDKIKNFLNESVEFENYQDKINKASKKKFKPTPDIVISDANRYTPNKNTLSLNYKNKKSKTKTKEEMDNINFQNILDRLNHELQHYAQFATLSQEEIEDVLRTYSKINNIANLKFALGDKKSPSPLIELDALQAESNPTSSSWFKTATNEQQKKIKANLDPVIKTVPHPEIVIGTESQYNPRTNKLKIGGREHGRFMTYEEILNYLKHELQHYYQTMELSQNEVDELMDNYRKTFYNTDIPLIEFDAIQAESEPFWSQWGTKMSEDQAKRMSEILDVPDPIPALRQKSSDEKNMKKAFLIYKSMNPPNIKLSNPLEPSEGMYYDLPNNNIVMGSKQKEDSFDEILNAILHETQHWAQNTELNEDDQIDTAIAYGNVRRTGKLPFVEYDATMAEHELPLKIHSWVENASPEQYKKLIEHFNIENPMPYEDVKFITIRHLLNKIKQIDPDFLPKNYEKNLIEDIKEGAISTRDARIEIQDILNNIQQTV